MIALALSAVIGLASHTSTPGWLDNKVAGYVMDGGSEDSNIGVYDKRSGFFMIRDFECDGAIKSILLTRDRKLVADQGFYVPGFSPNDRRGYSKLIEKPLRSLETGKGVKIGDSQADVRRRLGFPTEAKHTGARKQFVDYEYRLHVGKGDDAEVDEQRYTFKANKLIQIDFEHGSGRE